MYALQDLIQDILEARYGFVYEEAVDEIVAEVVAFLEYGGYDGISVLKRES